MNKFTVVALGKVVDSFPYKSKLNEQDYFGVKLLLIEEKSILTVYGLSRSYSHNEKVAFLVDVSMRKEQVSANFVADLSLDVEAIERQLENKRVSVGVPARELATKI